MGNLAKRFWNWVQSLPAYLAVTIVAIAFAGFDTFAKPISWVTVSLVAIAMSPWLIGYISSLELPGGLKVSLREAKRLEEDAAEVQTNQPLEPHTVELLDILGENPDLALAGLRIELERRLIEIARLYGKEINGKAVSVTVLARQLRDIGVLRTPEASVLLDLIPILNDAVHARTIPSDVRNLVVNAAKPVLAYLDLRIGELRAVAAVHGR